MTAFATFTRPLLANGRSLVGRSRSSVRGLSSSSTVRQSLQSPTYPGLFYHPLDKSPTTKYQLSFLPTPAPNPTFSPTTIGTFSPSLDKLREGEPPELTPRGWVENGLFKDVLHTVLEEGVKGDDEFKTLAVVRGDGYIHIADQRAPTDPNRVPDPNDIIASVLVQNGEIYAGGEGESAYERGELHRTVTMDGMMRLPEGLMLLLREALERVRAMEVEIAQSAK